MNNEVRLRRLFGRVKPAVRTLKKGDTMDANELIERMERETGQRIDADNSMALAGLFGAIAREMGRSQYQQRDDVAAGVLIQHQMSPEYRREQQSKEMIASLFMAGVSPETIKDMF